MFDFATSWLATAITATTLMLTGGSKSETNYYMTGSVDRVDLSDALASHRYWASRQRCLNCIYLTLPAPAPSSPPQQGLSSAVFSSVLAFISGCFFYLLNTPKTFLTLVFNYKFTNLEVILICMILVMTKRFIDETTWKYRQWVYYTAYYPLSQKTVDILATFAPATVGLIGHLVRFANFITLSEGLSFMVQLFIQFVVLVKLLEGIRLVDRLLPRLLVRINGFATQTRDILKGYIGLTKDFLISSTILLFIAVCLLISSLPALLVLITANATRKIPGFASAAANALGKDEGLKQFERRDLVAYNLRMEVAQIERDIRVQQEIDAVIDYLRRGLIQVPRDAKGNIITNYSGYFAVPYDVEGLDPEEKETLRTTIEEGTGLGHVFPWLWLASDHNGLAVNPTPTRRLEVPEFDDEDWKAIEEEEKEKEEREEEEKEEENRRRMEAIFALLGAKIGRLR